MHYECAACHNLFLNNEVEVDHINPVVDVNTGFISWDDFIYKLFCSEDNLQVLCKSCHKKKSTKEREILKLTMRNKK